MNKGPEQSNDTDERRARAIEQLIEKAAASPDPIGWVKDFTLRALRAPSLVSLPTADRADARREIHAIEPGGVGCSKAKVAETIEQVPCDRSSHHRHRQRGRGSSASRLRGGKAGPSYLRFHRTLSRLDEKIGGHRARSSGSGRHGVVQAVASALGSCHAPSCTATIKMPARIASLKSLP